MEAAIRSSSESAEVILRRSVSGTKDEGDKTVCHCNYDGGSILLPNFLGILIQSGDEISFPLPTDSTETGSEIYVYKSSFSGQSRDLYQAPISYAGEPKADKQDRLYVRAEISKGGLDVCSIHLPCEAIRDYFYVSSRRQGWERQTSLYDVLRIASTASIAELRVLPSSSDNWSSALPPHETVTVLP
jgi:hypothetical protein